MWNHTEYILVFANDILEKQKKKYIQILFYILRALNN